MSDNQKNLNRITYSITNLIDNLTRPTNKELRLILDIIVQKYYPGHHKINPTFAIKYYSNAIHNVIIKDFGYIVPIERLKRLKSFKQIVKKTTIGGDRKLHTEIRYKKPF